MRKKKIITIILIIAWMGLVFQFSHQPSYDSSELSGGITKAILNLLKITELENYEQLETVIRKLAHYSIYALGGLLILLHVNLYKISTNRKKVISFAIGTLYAITDEIHQLFVLGRSCEFRDVVIDSLGVATGILILLIILEILRKREMKSGK